MDATSRQNVSHGHSDHGIVNSEVRLVDIGKLDEYATSLVCLLVGSPELILEKRCIADALYLCFINC